MVDRFESTNVFGVIGQLVVFHNCEHVWELNKSLFNLVNSFIREFKTPVKLGIFIVKFGMFTTKFIKVGFCFVKQNFDKAAYGKRILFQKEIKRPLVSGIVC